MMLGQSDHLSDRGPGCRESSTLGPISQRGPHLGSSLLELIVCLAVLGLVLLALAVVLEVGTRYFARAQAAQLYHLHVEPLEILLAKQVRNCRFAIYSNLAAARAEENTGLVEQGNVLRADRQDGLGWFILQWDPVVPSLNLITDDGSGVPLTRSIRLWTGSSSLFDTSQGFLAIRCALPVPAALVSIYGAQTSEIEYLLTAEKQL